MAINYQFDVINPFQAALQGYGAGAQILQQERAAASEQAQMAQRNQLFALQMQEAQARLQTLQDERAKAEKAQEAATRIYDLLDQPDALMNVSAGDIAKIAVDNPELGKFIQEQKALLNTEQIKNEFNQQWSVAAALELKNIPQAQALLEQQAIAQENSGDVEKAKLTRGMIEQLNTPEGRDILKKSLFVSSSLLMPEQYDKLKTDLYNTVKLPFEIGKIEAELSAAAAKANGQPDPADRMKAEADLRQEWNRLNAPYKVMQQSIAQMRASAAQKSVPGDTALITQFRKLLDPTSVVREAEFAQTAEAGSLFTKLENLLAQQTEGTLIADKTRDQIVALGNQLMAVADAANRRDREPFEATSDAYGLNKRLIFGSAISGEIPKVYPDYANMTLEQLSKIDVMKMTDVDEIKAFNAANARALQKAGRGP